MKKHILKLTLGLAVAVTAGYTVYYTQVEMPLANIELENVEALASGELGGSGYTSHSYKCTYPDYKWAVSCSRGGSEYCIPSDC